MGEFVDVAEKLAGMLADNGITPGDLVDIIGMRYDGRVNCYPGEPGAGCCLISL